MTAKRVLFYVQYLQGIGHLKRAVKITRALTARGLAVDLISGGMPVPGLDLGGVKLKQLPPIRCRDGDFSDLIDDVGSPLSDTFREARKDALLAHYHETNPDALIIEAFPFGRRAMRFELLPLLEAASARSSKPLIVCSVRDILQISEKPGRTEETLKTLKAHYDYVMVHGDPALVRLDETFPLAHEITDMLVYTGLVADTDHEVPPARDGGEEILVSGGGGATRSEVLLKTAIEARAFTTARDRPWRLLAGPNLPTGELERLRAFAPEDVTVEPNRPDFAGLLAGCAVSVSQAGYNTMTDILRCGCRAVIVPYADHGQTEQITRAHMMQRLGAAEVVEPNSLSPETLARAIDACLTKPVPGPTSLDLNGAEASADLISEWLG